MNTESSKELKSDRVMELLFRAMKGEALSVKSLSEEYGVSPRSITRDINTLKNFLAEHRDYFGSTELIYSGNDHCYTLEADYFLSNMELLAITKILIGCRAFNSHDLLEIIRKLKMNTSYADRAKLDRLIKKELFNYSEIGSDCSSVLSNVWRLTDAIEKKKEISIDYIKMNRSRVQHRIKPVSIMFTEYYFYLIAYKCERNVENIPFYFRIDRITGITMHRDAYTLNKDQNINEGELRNKSMFMWPGISRHICFEFAGPSVQAILDRIPTAKITDHIDDKYMLEADVYGEGIKMFLLSQGAWVKVTGPSDFVKEMKTEIQKLGRLYE